MKLPPGTFAAAMTAESWAQPRLLRQAGSTQIRADAPASEPKSRKSLFSMANNRQQASIIVDGLRDAGFCITRVSVLSYDANPPQDSIPAGRVGGSPGEARGSGTDREPENGERRSFGGNSLTRPDSGAFLATGPMFAPLRGATAGAVEHRLIDLGFEACEAGRQVDRIKAGDILFSFQADTAAARDIKEILRVAGVPDLCPRSESPSPRAATARKFHVEP